MKTGWYWYREPGVNMQKPFPAWVYHNRAGAQGKIVYAQLIAQHEPHPIGKRLDECKGEWAGPIHSPPVFEERESNP